MTDIDTIAPSALNRARIALDSLRIARDEPATLTDVDRATLLSWPGWGAFAPAFEVTPTPGWKAIAEELDELLTGSELISASDQVDVSFYTPASVINVIFDLLRSTGFDGGRILEPGCGSGRFMAQTPQDLDVSWTGVEIDPVAARIARTLNPGAEIITGPLQKWDAPTGSFDAVIGNVPFSNTAVVDDAFGGYHSSLHGYFLTRALDAVRDGGYVIAITSRFTLDAETTPLTALTSPGGETRGELIAALRLPTGTFAAEGTDVVADILLIRKRAADEPFRDWNNSAENATRPDPGNRYAQITARLTVNEPAVPGTNSHPAAVNAYWAANPDHVAGTMRVTSFYKNPLVVLTSDPDVEIQLAARAVAAHLIPQIPRPTLDFAAEVANVPLYDPVGRKEGSFHVIDGNLHEVTGGSLVEIRNNAELKALVALRDLALDLIRLESDPDLPDTRITLTRTNTLQAYQAYVKKFGPLNRGTLTEGKVDPDTGTPTMSWRRPSMGGFRRDPDYVSVMALEQFNQDDGDAAPAPILLRRVNHRPTPATSADSPAEALSIVLGEGRGVNLNRVASLLGLLTADAALGALGDLVYLVDGHPVAAGEYLSGNVRAKMFYAQARALDEPAWERNVTALHQVVPRNLGPLDIRVSLGAPFVTADDVTAFVHEVLGAHSTIAYTRDVALWEVSGGAKGQWASQEAKLAYGTGRVGPLEVLEATLNGRGITVYDEHYSNGGTVRVRNTTETIAAAEKARALDDRFSLWIWEDEARATRVAAEYNRRFNSHVTRTFDGSHLTFDGLSDTVTPWPHQRDGVARIVGTERTLIGHSVGGGKAQPMDAKILTPTGFRRMSDFMVGDEVVAPDGTTTKVTGVFPQGPLDVSRLTFNDGSSTECNDEHLWAVTTHAAQRGRDRGDLRFKVMTLREIMDSGITTGIRAQLKYFVPMVKPVDLECGLERPLDPYWLGLLLGDGGVTTSSIHFTTADDELRKAFEAGLPKDHTLRKLVSRSGYDFAVRTGGLRSYSQQSLKRMLQDLGISGKDSLHKRIPRAYLEAPVSDRLAILQGLMDTDGDVSLRKSRDPMKPDDVIGSKATFNSSSRGLIEDVTWLVNSLGGTCGRSAEPSNRSINGTLHYRLTMTLPDGIVPFRLKRKAVGNFTREKYSARRFIKSIEKVGVKPMQCIAVEHPDHLYVTDNFIVTHNTLTAILSVMTLRKFGLAQKPLITVPNHLLEQIVREAQQAFPVGKFLIASKEDLTGDHRRLFAARCATGDWDAVVMTHGAFTSLPVSPEVEQRWIEEQKSELRAASRGTGYGSPKGAKAIARAVRGLDSRIGTLRSDERRDNNQVLFDHLGIDHITLDEAHLFRRLDTGSSSRDSGFSQGSSKRATDLLLKIDVLADRYPNKPIVTMLTGTAFVNSLSEAWTWQRYLQPDVLDAAGVKLFDPWVAAFVRAETAVEVAPDGSGFRMQRRPVGIKNVPEMLTMLGQVADILSAEQLGLERPSADFHTLVAEPTRQQADYVHNIANRAEALRRGKQSRPNGDGEDSMLLVVGDGRKVALDPTLVGIPEASTKLALVADEVARIHHTNAGRYFGDSAAPGALQLLTQDLGTPHPGDAQTYGRLRALLVQRGIPADRIRFVHEAKTDKARAAMFAQAREGGISVLFGSTAKVGMGTNIQTRLVALHHVDAPWTAADVEQREGRILRPGNLNTHVDIYRYVTEGSFDSYVWQGIHRKAASFAKLYAFDSSDRELEDISPVLLSYGEVKALAAGNPLLLDHAKATSDVGRLRLMRSVHLQGVNRARNAAADCDSKIRGRLNEIEDLESGLDILERNPDGQTHELMNAVGALKAGSKDGQTLAYWRGLLIRRPYREFRNELTLEIRAGYSHLLATVPLGKRLLRLSDEDLAATLQEMVERALADFQVRIDRNRHQIDALETEKTAALTAADTAIFDQRAELDEAIAHLARIDTLINEEAVKVELPAAA